MPDSFSKTNCTYLSEESGAMDREIESRQGGSLQIYLKHQTVMQIKNLKNCIENDANH
jgi:hypothetical protein